MSVNAQWPQLPPFTLDLRRRVFLGWDPENGYKRCWSDPEDSVGIIGPPRYGKTAGLIIPSVMYWDGPLVSTSTRGDVLAFTGDRRRAIAAPHDGSVLVYDPFGSEYPDLSMRWSPLVDCDNPAVCYRRVAAMTAVAGQAVQDGDHWRAGAAAILRPYFHAAALEGLPLSIVRGWLMSQETRDPTAILRTSSSPGAMWADDLDAMRLLGDRERGSFYSVARNTLEATAEPTVMNSCSGNDLSVDEFLKRRSSLFIIGPSHLQQAIAPLTAGLVDSIAQRAAELAAVQGGRLDPPLMLALDEIANIAPLQSLPSLVSEGGGRGIVTMWATQSLAQLRTRYGVELQAAILGATTAKLIFGGLSNSEDLRNISSWAGEKRQSTASVEVAPQRRRLTGEWGQPRLPESNETYTMSRDLEPALPVSAIQLLPPFHALLFWRSDPPRHVEARPAGAIKEFDRLRGFTR